MKLHYIIIITLLASINTLARAQENTDALFRKAGQSYVLFESERDKATNPDAMYNYLLESYNGFVRVANAPDAANYADAVKNRLRSSLPYFERAAIYYADKQNSQKALDFTMPYLEIPRMPMFRSELLSKSNQHATIIYFAGISAYKLQKYNQAITLFQEYLNTDGNELAKDAYVYLNLIYMAQKNYTEQEKVLEKAHTQYPLVLDFLYNLVNVHIATKNTQKLLATIDQILAIDPNNDKVLPLKARLLEGQARNQEALDIYKRLYSLNPNNFEILTGLARANFNYATEIINNGVTITDNTEYALVRQRASVYLLDAQELFIKILQTDPTSKQYMSGLASVFQYMDMLDEYEVLNQIIKDGAGYNIFPARLQAYNEQQQKAPVQQKEEQHMPRPVNPAQLVISIDEFFDANQNKVIDAGEGFSIMFTIENRGLGDAFNVRIRLSEQQGLDRFFDGAKEMDGGNIPAGSSKQFTMRYIVAKDMPTNNARINIYAFEANGFDADPVEMLVSTMEYAMPRLGIADHQFFATEGTAITLGNNGKLSVAIRNDGTVTAGNVKVNFKLPANVYTTDSPEMTIDSIPPGEVAIINYGFLVNKRFDQDSIAVLMAVSEDSRSSYINDAFKVKVGDYLTTASTIRIDGLAAERKEINRQEVSLAFKSELLEDVPVGGTNRHRYALVIGNEDYSMTGANAEINVPYAVNDALVFREYCIRTFGIPDSQVKLVSNATTGIMHEQLDWLVNMGSTDPEAELFFFFSGHGNNDEQSKEPYLIPVDITGKNIRLGISIKELYSRLSAHPVKGAYVFLDACFSGGYKSEAPLIAQKGVRVVPKTGLPMGNTISFSSSSGDQTSSVFHEKKQGYYTYYLIKTLQDSKGDISMKELFKQTNASVRKATALIGKIQEPQVMVSPSIGYDWEGTKLKTVEMQ